ncbi:MAG: hypothetical protein ACRC62_03670 [Microcoleus sp.]
MLQIAVQDHSGEWSEFIADSPMEAINTLLEICRSEGPIRNLKWADVPEFGEF